MAYSINQALLIGNVSKAPELRMTESGQAVCNFNMATNRSVKQGEEWKNVPTFHQIVVWAKQAEAVAAGLVVGQKVTVLGRIDNRSYTDKNGVKKFMNEIVADSVIWDGPKKDQSPSPQTVAQAQQQADTAQAEDVSDEIPF